VTETSGDQQYGVNVIRRALEEPLRPIAHEAWVASLMLTTEALIAERPKRGEDDAPAGMNEGMGGMGM
jgi:chaperonin GroEL (HSP60 family)